MAALGVTHTPHSSVEVERLTIRSEGDLLTFYAADNGVTHQLREGGVDGAQHAEYGSVVVMLDGEAAFRRLAGSAELEICWGANLGTAGERLIRGGLSDVADAISSARNDVRSARGWVMDIYLLRKLSRRK